MNFIKNKWKYIVVALISLIVGAGLSSGPEQEELDSSIAEIEKLEKELSSGKESIAVLAAENEELQAKVDEAAPWFKMSEQEKVQKEAEAKAAEEKRLAEEKAKKEAEEKAKAEAEAAAKAEEERKAKIGYDTGITYDQLARTPDDYIADKIKFRGKVIQVIEGDEGTEIRLAVNSNYDTVVYAAIPSGTTSSRILEDDIITVYGVSAGLISYQSTMGGQISIPSMYVEKVDQ